MSGTRVAGWVIGRCGTTNGRRIGAAIAAACLVSLPLGAQAGEIHGRVSVLGRGGRASRSPGPTLVYLEGAPGSLTPTDVTIEMRRKAFSPRVVVVPVGSTVRFPNLDRIHHNAFSVSGQNRFDLKLYKRPHSRSKTFRHAGEVRVYCNIHPQMSAIVLVRDNPYYAWVGRDGRFVLRDVPPGRHRLRVWNERAPEVERVVTVSEEGHVGVELTLDASRHRRVRHKNKYGKEYRLGGKY